jgi:hypothetical protein
VCSRAAMDILKNRNSPCFRQKYNDGHSGHSLGEVRYFGLFEYECCKLKKFGKAAR